MESKFLVFGGDFSWTILTTLCPDFVGSFDSLADARKGIPDRDWWQIVDVNTLQIVEEGHKS